MIYDISYKTLIGLKPLRIRFDKLDGIIKIFDGSKYPVLLDLENYDAIYIRIRYVTSIKSCITYFAKIKFLTILQKQKLILMIICL